MVHLQVAVHVTHSHIQYHIKAVALSDSERIAHNRTVKCSQSDITIPQSAHVTNVIKEHCGGGSASSGYELPATSYNPISPVALISRKSSDRQVHKAIYSSYISHQIGL
jgi:F0F1-type ATP synthase beta subunit